MIRRLAPLAALLALGCQGADDTDPVDEPDAREPAVLDFTCDPGAVPQAVPLRRLTRLQHFHTLEALVLEALPDHVEAVREEIRPAMDALVEDQPQGPDPHFGRLSRLDQTVSQAHVDRSWDAARAVAVALTTPERLPDLAGSCAPEELDCLAGFVEQFGALALRRPLTEADVDHYLRAVQDNPVSAADWADVTTLLLLAPDHLYLVQSVLDEEDPEGRPPRLDAWSLASKLSYHAWQGPPDEELRALAASGELLMDHVYEAQVSRVFSDPRARGAMASFYEEWLGNHILEELDSRVGRPVFDTFRGDLLPASDLREAMLEEITDSAVYYTFDAEGTWDDVLTSDRSFARHPQLADIYGVPVWDGASEPPNMVQGSRAGLITRAGYLATGSANTRPIMKGVFLRTTLLCDEVPPPPDNVVGNTPPPEPDVSTRVFVEQLTGGAECAGCHASINPLGFVTEDFDALGRPRAVQTLIDGATGEIVGEAEVDTVVQPNIDHRHQEAADAQDLTALLVASPKPRACFSRLYVRHTLGRMEDEALDGCALQAVDEALDEGRPIREALEAVALTDAFRRRALPAE
jgi:hypothetical protein